MSILFCFFVKFVDFQIFILFKSFQLSELLLYCLLDFGIFDQVIQSHIWLETFSFDLRVSKLPDYDPLDFEVSCDVVGEAAEPGFFPYPFEKISEWLVEVLSYFTKSRKVQFGVAKVTRDFLYEVPVLDFVRVGRTSSVTVALRAGLC